MLKVFILNEIKIFKTLLNKLLLKLFQKKVTQITKLIFQKYVFIFMSKAHYFIILI